MNIFGQLVHVFGQLVHIFGKLVHVFARKLVPELRNKFREIGGHYVGPDVMQSGFGVNFFLGPANCRKIAGEFLREF